MSACDFSNWLYYKRGIISKMPPYLQLQVNPKSLFNHFRRALYIRWSSDFDKTSNRNYYQVVRDGQFSLAVLPSKTRNMVRRCLNNCEIKKVDYSQIVAGRGYEVYASEYRRYARNGHPSPSKEEKDWAVGMKEAAERGQEFWAVIHNGIIVAYSICWKFNQHVDLVTWKVDYDNFNHLYPSYGLVYGMCDYYLN